MQTDVDEATERQQRNMAAFGTIIFLAAMVLIFLFAMAWLFLYFGQPESATRLAVFVVGLVAGGGAGRTFL